MKNERLYKVVLSPHISEKATLIAEKSNVYVFEVLKNASSLEIKNAIEHAFNVKVEDVRVVNVKPKKKMFKGQEGTRQAWKKAYVTLKADQALNMVGAQ